jgi:hypothetical protein
MAMRERDVIRLVHLVLSVPIVGYLYGPVASIPRAAWFTHWIAFPVVVLSGLWLWLKPRIARRLAIARIAGKSVAGGASRASGVGAARV